MAQMHQGGCQCGAVRYQVEADIEDVMSCNCSRCQRLGWLLTFAPASAFKLLSGDDATTDYLFNKHVIHHLFCSTCGIESFARGKNSKGEDVVAINARCIDGIDLDALNVKKVDGASR